MRTSIEQYADSALDCISSLPCEYAEIRLGSGVVTSIILSGDQIDSVSSGDTTGGCIRILHKGSWGFVTFNDIDNLKKHVKTVLSLSKTIHSATPSTVAGCASVRARFSTNAIQSCRDISIEEKFNLISAYNDILRNSNFIQTTRAVYNDRVSQSLFVNSEGSVLTYDKSFCGVSLTAVAKDGSVIEPFSESHAGYGGFELARHREESAEAVVKTAVDLLKAESLPGGTYTVIADQRLAGVFIHEAFGHLSEADFIYENERMRSLMSCGRKIANDTLTVIDDGTLPVLPGYIPFDDEGVPPRTTFLIQNGVIHGHLHSRETASMMGEEPTGNGRALSVMNQPIVRMTNTYIENGTCAPQELFESVDDGLYVVDAVGGQTNLEMFTFSSGYAYRIKKGKPGTMYKNVILSGNVFTTLNNISMVANDRKMFGGLGGCGKRGQSPLPVAFGGPHLRINNVLVGGGH